MAGAGYKQFADGDVLTAAQVQTYLQDQAVMKFADSSARTTGLGTAVAEGMVSYLADTDAVEVYDGSAWATVGNAGIGANVVQAVGTAQFSTTSTTYQSVTGLSASITPTSATSKILVLANVPVAFDDAGNTDRTGFVTVFRGATDLCPTDAFLNVEESTSNLSTAQAAIAFLDSPATTSSTTYDVRVKLTVAGTVYVNRGKGGTGVNTVSTLTLIEVKA